MDANYPALVNKLERYARLLSDALEAWRLQLRLGLRSIFQLPGCAAVTLMQDCDWLYSSRTGEFKIRVPNPSLLYYVIAFYDDNC